MIFTKIVELSTPINSITKIEICVDSMVLYTSCDLSVNLKDKNNTVIDTRKITIGGDDYIRWGADDKYLEEYVISKLN